MEDDDRPPRSEEDMRKTMEIFEKIKNLKMVYMDSVISVAPQLANSHISYIIKQGLYKIVILKSYNRDHWIIYKLGPPIDICISRNYNFNEELYDLLPINWKRSNHLLDFYNNIFISFNKQAMKLI